jgi:hypothetical protein
LKKAVVSFDTSAVERIKIRAENQMERVVFLGNGEWKISRRCGFTAKGRCRRIF